MSWTRRAVAAVAEHLASAGVGVYSEAAYPSSSTPAIVVGVMPDSPAVVVGLSPYGVEDTVHEHSTLGVQVRCRALGDPRDAYDLDDAVFLALHLPLGATLGTTDPVAAAVSYRQSGSAPLGVDPAGRFELVSNYYVVLPRASVAPWS